MNIREMIEHDLGECVICTGLVFSYSTKDRPLCEPCEYQYGNQRAYLGFVST
jgi:hypothetical protein